MAKKRSTPQKPKAKPKTPAKPKKPAKPKAKPKPRSKSPARSKAASEEAPAPPPEPSPTPPPTPAPEPTPPRSTAGTQLPLPLRDPTPSQRFATFLLRMFNGLSRHADDILGILLLMLASYGLLGLSGQSPGILTDRMATNLVSGLGWGAIFVPLGLGLLGGVLIARRFNPNLTPPWWRVIAGELGLMCALAWTQLRAAGLVAEAAGITLVEALQTGDLLTRAMEGEGGGVVGWSVALLLAERIPLLAGVLLLLGAVVGLWLASGLRLRHVVWGLHRLQVLLGAEQGQFPEVPQAEPPPVVTARTPIAGNRPAVVSIPSPDVNVPQRFTVKPVASDQSAEAIDRDASLPPLTLLSNVDMLKPSATNINRNAMIIEQTLADFGIPVNVINYQTGPAVTQYAVEPGYIERTLTSGEVRRQKVRVSQISGLVDDLALALQASPIRIEAPVPGHSYVGIEVPNRQLSLVSLRGIIESETFQKARRSLTVGLGRDVSGKPIVADLSRMPHLLIAGTTGSGKSVAVVNLISCLILNNAPKNLRLVMIDPKKVELTRFNGLPHLLGRVETELERIIGTLRWVMHEMDKRYRLLEEMGARDLDTYNRKLGRRREHERLPYICVLVDELADLMMMAPDETEKTLVRLAQMARATGIHLVVATQRPSVDILTGLIKANFPARISFAVPSSIDSRVILDETGAETLLGRGDMLYLAADASGPRRLQGAFVGDTEIEAIVDFWKAQALDEQLVQAELRADLEARRKARAAAEAAATTAPAPWDKMLARQSVMSDKDSDIERAIAVVRQYGEASASLLQRKLNLGYPRAARLMDELQQLGVVGEAKAGGKTREVLIGKDDDPIGDAAFIIGDDED